MTPCKALSWVLMLAVTLSCDRSAEIKGQKNASLTFYGLTVDQDGKPLANVSVAYECESFPKDWTFDRRGEPFVKSIVRTVSDEHGRFRFALSVHTLRRLDVDGPAGYRHFFEQYEGTVSGEVIPSTYGYLVSSWSDLCYKTDADHPAIFVFVKDGAHEVSALPCKGGYDSGNGKRWVLNTPGWPKKPSLKDVVQKPPTTVP